MENIYYIFSKYYHNALSKCRNCNDEKKAKELLAKKFIHTFRVVSNAKELCFYLDLPQKLCNSIEIASIFHDIGRFDQALQYVHFKDKQSFNHAEKSAAIFLELKSEILEYISEETFNDIHKAILYHNQIILPCDISDNCRIISNVLRDADKLNILAINLNSKFIKFDGTLTTNEEINPKCIEDFLSNRVVNGKCVFSELDNNVKLLSWLYDFNYDRSIKLFLKNNYLDILTDTSNIKSVVIKEFITINKEHAQQYIESRGIQLA